MTIDDPNHAVVFLHGLADFRRLPRDIANEVEDIVDELLAWRAPAAEVGYDRDAHPELIRTHWDDLKAELATLRRKEAA